MATQKPVEAPRVKLSAENVTALRSLDIVIARAEQGLAGLERLGMDVAELRAGLELTKAQRKIMLEEFA